MALAVTLTALGIGGFCIGWTLYYGIGTWGNNRPVAWGFGIINFVFWVGIGHAGTLISAILFLFRARWRNAIARFAEAMTIFAVMCAAIFPVLHTGRPWFAYWLFPYPNERGTLGELPLAARLGRLRGHHLLFGFADLLVPRAWCLTSRRCAIARPKGWRKRIYTVLSLGWRGAASHWVHYDKAYLLLAGLATGLVISVHSVVSFDFAVSLGAGLAHDHLPALLRRGRHLRRLRHGGHRANRCAQDHESVEPHHRQSSGRDEQADPGHVVHHGLRVLHGGRHRLVQRQSRTSSTPS